MIPLAAACAYGVERIPHQMGRRKEYSLRLSVSLSLCGGREGGRYLSVIYMYTHRVEIDTYESL